MTANRGGGETASAARRKISLEDAQPPGPVVKTALKVILSLAVLFVIIAIIVSFPVDWYGSRKLKNAQAAARAGGLPVHLSDAYYLDWNTTRPVAQGENAAVYYEAAYSLLRISEDEETLRALPVIGSASIPADPRQPLLESMVEDIRRYLAPRKGILELLHTGATVPRCHYSVHWDSYNAPLPYLARAHDAARLIVLEMYLAAEEGGAEEAIRAARDGLALGRSLLEEPAYVSAAAAMSVDAMIINEGLDRVLARTNPSNDQLAALEGDLAEGAKAFSLRTALGGEIANWGDLYDRVLDGRASPMYLGNVRKRRSVPPAGAVAEGIVWLARGYIKADRAHMTRALTALVGDASAPTPEVLEETRVKKAKRAEGQSWYLFSRMFMPELVDGPVEGERARARLRAAAACVAAARYRNDKGRWPEDLEALTPAYIAAVPMDPFTGKPLMWKVSANGAAAYSVGVDLADNDGRPRLAIRPKQIDEKIWDDYDDVGFRVWK